MDAFQRVIDSAEKNSPFKSFATKLNAVLKSEKWETMSPQEKHDMADNILLLIRMSYPFGVNMLNPQGLPDQENSLSDEQPMIIQVGDVSLQIEKVKDTSFIAVVHGKQEDGKTHTAHIHPLRDNSFVVAGRNIAISNIVGLKSNVIHMWSDIEILSRQVSRGAIMILKQDGRIYVYDRGSRNEVTVKQGSLQVNYDPVSVIRADGTQSFGDSVLLTGGGFDSVLLHAVDAVMASQEVRPVDEPQEKPAVVQPAEKPEDVN